MLLNATQHAEFSEQGYLLLEDLIPDEIFEPVIADIEQGIERGALEAAEAAFSASRIQLR